MTDPKFRFLLDKVMGEQPHLCPGCGKGGKFHPLPVTPEYPKPRVFCNRCAFSEDLHGLLRTVRGTTDYARELADVERWSAEYEQQFGRPVPLPFLSPRGPRISEECWCTGGYDPKDGLWRTAPVERAADIVDELVELVSEPVGSLAAEQHLEVIYLALRAPAANGVHPLALSDQIGRRIWDRRIAREREERLKGKGKRGGEAPPSGPHE